MTDSRRDRGPAVHVLRVGAVPGVTVTKWQRIWADRWPQVTLELVDVAEDEQRTALDENRVDMCFVRLPVDTEGLHAIPLYTEVPVVVVPQDHPVALYDEVTSAELGGEDVVDPQDASLAVDLVAGGAGVLFVPQSVARSYSRRDVVHRPVSDGEATQISLAWLQENPSELIEEFIGIVRGRTPNSSRGPRPDDTGPGRQPPDSPPGRAAGSPRPGNARRSRGAARRPPRPPRGH